MSKGFPVKFPVYLGHILASSSAARGTKEHLEGHVGEVVDHDPRHLDEHLVPLGRLEHPQQAGEDASLGLRRGGGPPVWHVCNARKPASPGWQRRQVGACRRLPLHGRRRCCVQGDTRA
ncbi:hypothetical protein HPB48_012816 [Haemaphysalis longicornis]|uniref:Uncharacterized protein n=1 Tax=Haemaphysalis longicornis TaxID=44386 RepID=A0A9J6GAE6_HAELO|nr:hypothetical protein HPB48_012816 [Haemaphysalis longicornis]